MPPKQINQYPSRAPRFCHGMAFGDWFRLLKRNRFRIHPLRWGLTFTVTCVSIFNSVMRVLQKLTHDRALAQTGTEPGPVFILGHWRSGTTLLHELMSLDDQ